MSWTPPRCPCLPYSTHQQGPSAPPPKSYPEPRNFSPPAPLCLLLHPATIPWPWDCTSLLPQWAPSFWLHPTVCSLHRHSCQRDPARTKSQHTPPLLRAPPHGSHLPKSKKPKSSQWPRDPYRLSDLISRPSTLASLLWSLNISSTFLPVNPLPDGILIFPDPWLTFLPLCTQVTAQTSPLQGGTQEPLPPAFSCLQGTIPS